MILLTGECTRAHRPARTAVTLQVLQIDQHLPRALIAPLTIFLQTLPYYSFKLRRQVIVKPRNRLRLTMSDSLYRLGRRRGAEWQSARCHFVHHYSKGKDVCAVI